MKKIFTQNTANWVVSAFMIAATHRAIILNKRIDKTQEYIITLQEQVLNYNTACNSKMRQLYHFDSCVKQYIKDHVPPAQYGK